VKDPSFEQLTSTRLIVRRFASSDAEALASYRSDREVARYQDWDCPYPISEARKFIAGLQQLAPGTPGAWFQFAVSLADSGALIGDAALHVSTADARDAELGFTFAAAHHGQGYATEAVRAVVRYAFMQLAMERVFSRIDSRNVRARRLLERIGFRQEGEPLERAWFKGDWSTELLYAQLESEWRLAGEL
jgi:RimJ/RimL family protein N-acetyltransferase